MKARALIAGASFGAETVKAMCLACYEVWVRLAPIASDALGEADVMRMRLSFLSPSRATRTLRPSKSTPST